jgi:Permuted papain-like amidase enzyme, YaeF/YiiX, C92 family
MSSTKIKARRRFSNWVIRQFGLWLTHEIEPKRTYLSDYHKICLNIKPGDVLLVEGRTRVSNIIKLLTRSAWSHSALYVGEIKDIKNAELVARLKHFYDGTDDTKLVIESIIGKGTIVSPISNYQNEHVRICRPTGIIDDDVEKVIQFATTRLGRDYDLRHILDLARYLFPWTIYPRRWRSTLFTHNALQPTKDICSVMIAQAFMSVHYPILPLVEYSDLTGFELTKRNPRLFTPSDFDYSPYFEIIKYPILDPIGTLGYRNFRWKKFEYNS